MPHEPQPDAPFRFAAYHANPATGELYKHGIRLKLQEQPFQVLLMLLERPGAVVSREELRQRLWAETTFVDFDHCLNIAMNKLRETLNDSPENPRFIETLPKRGYRFIAPVERMGASAGAAGDLRPSIGAAAPAVASARGAARAWWVAAAALVVLVGAMWMVWQGREMPQGASAVQTKRLMLAVLPFENLTADAQQDYFVAGLTEEMIAQLGRMHASRLGVIARTSILQYAGTRKPITEIGRELKVDYVLEGSVRRERERVRVTVQLIQVSDQTHLWAETFDRGVDDLLRVQSEVAHDVAGALALELLPGEQEAMERMPTEDMGAYDDYLRGRHFWNRRTESDFERAIEYLESAIRKDAKFARAHAALADTYNLMGGYAFRPAQEVFPKAKEAARRAMELDPALSASHAALGFAAFNYDWDFREAEKQFREALRRNPNNATAHQWYAELLHAWGRLAEAREEIARALELDPLSMAVMDDKGWILVSEEKLEEAVRQFEAEAELNPQWPYAYYSLAAAHVYRKDFERARAVLERARAAGGETARYLQVQGMAQAFGGEKQKARETLAKLLARPERERGPRYGLAVVYAGLGESDAALGLLERALQERDSWMVWLRTYPEWAPLREDPRFRDLLKRINSGKAS
jgi:TolB-like protein/DNA-binding winged helix-turn-helix (wHTH) protein/Tfp pilus assembly protein PilF